MCDVLGAMIPANSPRYKFEIQGKLVSKKNARPIFRNKKTGKVFLGKSDRLKEFEERCQLILTAQKNRYGLKEPISYPLQVNYLRIEIEGAQRQDLDNILTSIFDAMQDCGIIKNDKQFRYVNSLYIIDRAIRDLATIEIQRFQGMKPTIHELMPK